MRTNSLRANGGHQCNFTRDVNAEHDSFALIRNGRAQSVHKIIRLISYLRKRVRVGITSPPPILSSFSTRVQLHYDRSLCPPSARLARKTPSCRFLIGRHVRITRPYFVRRSENLDGSSYERAFLFIVRADRDVRDLRSR